LKDAAVAGSRDAISVAPVLTWLLVQLAALVVAALRVPLAAEYPQPAEFYAVRVLLATQFAWATMLFPSLLRTGSMVGVAISSAWVMLVFAAALAAWPIAGVLEVAAFLTLWICILAMVRAALPWRWQLIASAIASTYVIGGPLLWYLQSDLGTSSPVESGMGFGPLSIGVTAARNLPRTAWWGEVGIGLVAAAALLASHYLKLYPSSYLRVSKQE
jgi:hypothetical protein